MKQVPDAHLHRGAWHRNGAEVILQKKERFETHLQKKQDGGETEFSTPITLSISQESCTHTH
jgi:hypothetical protein